MPQSDVLNSWKEISNYVGRGVRTVQRWEKDFHLPVRRPSGHLKGSVLALKHEIDEWLNTREAREARDAAAVQRIRPTENSEAMTRLHQNMTTLQARCTSFGLGTNELQNTLRRTEELHEQIKARRMKPSDGVAS